MGSINPNVCHFILYLAITIILFKFWHCLCTIPE